MSASEYWNELSEGQLTDEEIALYAQHLNWNCLSRFGTLNEKTWLAYKERISYINLSYNKTVPASVYNELRENVYWLTLEKKRETDFEFINQICENFSTVHYSRNNPSAKKIAKKEWDLIGFKNGKIMKTFTADEKSIWIRNQIVDLTFLAKYEKIWDSADWKQISQYQRLTYDFAKEYSKKLDLNIIRNENKVHMLSEDELIEMEKGVKKSFLFSAKDFADGIVTIHAADTEEALKRMDELLKLK